MCGLFGTTIDQHNSSALKTARNARDVLVHRGPDQSGEWVKDHIYMGHRRLSILDLSPSGQQPMVTDDNKIGITVNGEIYNYPILKKELAEQGYVFKSTSDSEIVLHGYKHWGVKLLSEKIDGMYAVVIHDTQKQKIYAFRDRVGIKPLYYHHDGKDFSWASELSALLQWLPEDKHEVDNTALFDFLIYRYIPAPKSAYKRIKKLQQAHILEYDISQGDLYIERYWSLPVSEKELSTPKTHLKKLIEKSVQDQMISDVPIGFLLSGGIDSSVIAVVGAQLTNSPLTFSIGFQDKKHDETMYAKQVSDLSHTKHFSRILDDNDVSDMISMMQKWFTEPFGDTSAIPTHKVCGFAREYVTVALSGDGGDELFGGYTWYSDYERIQVNGALRCFLPKKGINFPSWMPKSRGLFLRSIKDPLEQYAQLRAKISPIVLKQWKKALNIPSNYDPLWAYRPHFNQEHGLKKSLQVVDFHTYLPDDILTKVDRVSMDVSLECRPPFLSKEIIEFAFSLPEEVIYKNNQLKGYLKDSFSQDLPHEILYKKKQGFSIPKLELVRALKQSKETSPQEIILKEFLNGS